MGNCRYSHYIQHLSDCRAMDSSSISLIMLGGGWSGRSSCSSVCMGPGMVVSSALTGVSSGVRGVRVGLGVVLRIPLHGRFRWPFTVVGLGTGYVIFVHRVCIQVGGAFDETCIDGLE